MLLLVEAHKCLFALSWFIKKKLSCLSACALQKFFLSHDLNEQSLGGSTEEDRYRYRKNLYHYPFVILWCRPLYVVLFVFGMHACCRPIYRLRKNYAYGWQIAGNVTLSHIWHIYTCNVYCQMCTCINLLHVFILRNHFTECNAVTCSLEQFTVSLL